MSSLLCTDFLSGDGLSAYEKSLGVICPARTFKHEQVFIATLLDEVTTQCHQASASVFVAQYAVGEHFRPGDCIFPEAGRVAELCTPYNTQGAAETTSSDASIMAVTA